jgi:hypothetical protein
MVSKWTARFTDFHLFFQKKLLGYFSFLHEAKKRIKHLMANMVQYGVRCFDDFFPISPRLSLFFFTPSFPQSISLLHLL